MTNCAMNIIGLPATIPTDGLELRVGPPVLTSELLEKLQREARAEGKILFLDEMTAYVA